MVSDPALSQNSRTSRRIFLLQSASLVAAASAGLTHDDTAAAESQTTIAAADSFLAKEAERPRGAIYIPARAYNAYQMWHHYDPPVTRRDCRYAGRLGLNAFRLWLSFEFWRHDHNALRHSFENLLHICFAQGIKVMPVLFEGDGIEPTAANIADTHPLTASDLLSPSSEVVQRRKQWCEPLEYVDWFMHHFRNDRRLLAIEIQNEPWGPARHAFARAMVAHAAAKRGTVPLSIGGADVAQSAAFMPAGVDILQTHQNFPPSASAFRQIIRTQVIAAQKAHKRPVWITEWQRLRPGGSGWGNQALRGNQWQPDYATMAPIVRAFPVGNFFWSLMLKPAWLLAQRSKGTLNGVFHEDGAVWSLADARAISGNSHFQATQRAMWPEWAKIIPQTLGKL